MAEQRRTKRQQRLRPAKAASDLEDSGAAARVAGRTDDDSERALGRIVSLAVPSVGLVAAVVTGELRGLAPAILVLAGTALLGTIGFLWASLRTLSGEAPLPEGVQTHSLVSRAPAPERKRETLRALKDLEFEHSIGKIDDADYRELSSRYRTTAKALMREIDTGLAPRRKEAERLVEAYLAGKDLAPKSKASGAEPSPAVAAAAGVSCAKCSTSNDDDAAFCKKCGAPVGQASVSAAGKESSDASA